MKTKNVIKNWLGFFFFLATYVVARLALQRFVLPGAPPFGWDVFAILLGVVGLLSLVLLVMTNEEKGVYAGLWLTSLVTAGATFWAIPEALEISRYALIVYLAIFFLIFVMSFVPWLKAQMRGAKSHFKPISLLVQVVCLFAGVALTEWLM